MQLIKTIAVVCFACLGIVFSSALAEPAVVIKEDNFAGGAFDGDGNPVVVLCTAMTVETNSETGVIHASCQGKGLANNSGRAVKYDIYNNPFYWQDGILIPCGVFLADGTLVFTENWTETISASGNYVFRCKVNLD